MRRPAAVGRHARQRQLLGELVEALAAGAPGTLDRGLAAAWHAAADDAQRLRVVIDQVAQLTDSSAVAWHDRLVSRDA
jgi:dGTPase